MICVFKDIFSFDIIYIYLPCKNLLGKIVLISIWFNMIFIQIINSYSRVL